MCFTVNVNLIKEELENRYGATFLDPDSYRPSYYYHAFGLPFMPAVTSDRPDRITLLQWGLIPEWVRDRAGAEEIRLKTLNARAESVESKPSFSSSFSSRRCIVPVKGFFEWKHTPNGKIPYYIYRADNDVMSLAGIWSGWTDNSTGEVLNTFSVITTEANELMAGIHNSKKRMPALIEREREREWLDRDSTNQSLIALLKTYPSSILTAYEIGELINNRSSDKNRPELIRPYTRPRENTLF